MNIYDIAKEAGVSISTVSRVLNNKSNVKEKTRKKVEEVLEKNHYHPSAIARGLVSNSMHTVAVLAVDIRVPHYARTAYTIEREFSRRGYKVLLCNTGGEVEETAKYFRIAIEKNIDGMVLVGSVFNRICKEPEISRMLGTIPIVSANGKIDADRSYSVLVDDGYGISLAVNSMVEKGRRELYYLKDLDTGSARLKCEGFLDAAARVGIEGGKSRVIETEMGLEGGIRAVEKLIREGRYFDGIVCGEDITAAGVLKGVLRAGLKVPDDVAISGFNNSEYARICEPRLTTIDNKPDLVAMLSVQLLSSLIEETDTYSSCTIQPELVPGETI